MSSPEQSPTSDAAHGLQLRSRRPPRHRLVARRVPGANKRSVLGVLALVLGAAAAATPDGLVLGVPLLTAGSYLMALPLLAARRTG